MISKVRKKRESFKKYRSRLINEKKMDKQQRKGTVINSGNIAAKHPNNQKGTNSKTPRNKHFPNLNRAGRRSLLYKNSLSKLLDTIFHLRYDMIGSGVPVPKMPRYKNPKFLSGYYSRLIQLAIK